MTNGFLPSVVRFVGRGRGRDVGEFRPGPGVLEREPPPVTGGAPDGPWDTRRRGECHHAVRAHPDQQRDRQVGQQERQAGSVVPDVADDPYVGVAVLPVPGRDSVRRELTRRALGHRTPHRDKVRARIVLPAARRDSNAGIAGELHITVDTIRTWRGRFTSHGVAGLVDRPQSGRPPRSTPVQVAQVKALAYRLPARSGAPLSRWSCPELAHEVVSQGHRRGDLRIDGAPVAGPGRGQTLAVPVVDLPPRPRFRGQGPMPLV